MKDYIQAVVEFRVKYFVEAVIEADGSVKAGAASIGAHPNTVSSVLNRAGVNFRDLRKAAAERKKPVQSAGLEGAERRTA